MPRKMMMTSRPTLISFLRLGGILWETFAVRCTALRACRWRCFLPTAAKRTANRQLLRCFYEELQPVDPADADARAFGQRGARHGVPQFAVHEYFPLGAELSPRDADLPDHALASCGHPHPARAKHERREKDGDQPDGNAHNQCGEQVHSHLGNRTIDEKQRPENHADHASNAEDAMRGVLGLEGKQYECKK